MGEMNQEFASCFPPGFSSWLLLSFKEAELSLLDKQPFRDEWRTMTPIVSICTKSEQRGTDANGSTERSGPTQNTSYQSRIWGTGRRFLRSPSRLCFKGWLQQYLLSHVLFCKVTFPLTYQEVEPICTPSESEVGPGPVFIKRIWWVIPYTFWGWAWRGHNFCFPTWNTHSWNPVVRWRRLS